MGLQIISEDLFDKTVQSIRYEIEKITGTIKRIAKVKNSRNKVNLTYQSHELAKQAKESMKRQYPDCEFVKKDSGLGTSSNRIPTGSAWGRTLPDSENKRTTTQPRDYSDYDSKRSRY